MVSLLREKQRSELNMILADEKIKEFKRKQMLENAGANAGLKESLIRQFGKERDRAREVISKLMADLDKLKDQERSFGTVATSSTPKVITELKPSRELAPLTSTKKEAGKPKFTLMSSADSLTVGPYSQDNRKSEALRQSSLRNLAKNELNKSILGEVANNLLDSR